MPMNDRFRKSSGQHGPDRLFASAVELHQQGRLREAEAAYRDLLAADPLHAGALHYLGVVQLQMGRAEAAAELIRRSLAQHERNPEGHYHLGLALAQLGQFADVVVHNERAIALQPQYVEAHLNLGNSLKALGRLADAQAAYERVIGLAPDLPEAHFNLANLLIERGRADEAITVFERTLALRPAYPEALNNLAGALLVRGRVEPALQRYRQALALRADFSEAMVGQSLAHLMQDDAFTAMALLCKALAIRPARQAKDLFVTCARRLSTCPNVPELRNVLGAALREPWSRPRLFARFAAAVLKNKGPVADALAEMQGDDALSPGALRALATDALLGALLENTPVADLQLETLLTAARRGLLAYCEQASQPADALLPFACSLARQCFINEYVFDMDAGEHEILCKQRQRLTDLCVAGGMPLPILVATVACYGPLYLQPEHERLLDQSWSLELKAVITQQVHEPATERRLAAAVPQFTSIDDTTSLAVQQQYEENPFPRWVKTLPAGHPVSFDAYLREILPLARLDPVNRTPVEILIAGCGTGQQPVELAARVSPVRILAVDLSRASLGYAGRKTAELGLSNIEYGQADILRLSELGRQFDVIQASGVLHHMAEPFAAWHQLLDLLRPGGLMLLGFYSELARTEVTAARAFIAEHGFTSDAAGIRRARAAIAALPDDMPIRLNLLAPDFFSMSECRDLLFHVAEQCLTIPQIARFIREARLEFLGFQLPPDIAGQYAAANPDDPTMTDLDCWHAFEQAHRHTFLGMYQFWVKSTSGRDAERSPTGTIS
jgi:Flp pilus assembly protein TadD/2-polyprenyl-3-methyl-5-hydroxy-6-metoxy-1,4-benzoquinol methylase